MHASTVAVTATTTTTANKDNTKGGRYQYSSFFEESLLGLSRQLFMIQNIIMVTANMVNGD